MNKFIKEIEKLAEKSSKAEDSTDALRFSQSALNLANTVNTQAVKKINEAPKIR